jgi:hypothetical protein
MLKTIFNLIRRFFSWQIYKVPVWSFLFILTLAEKIVKRLQDKLPDLLKEIKKTIKHHPRFVSFLSMILGLFYERLPKSIKLFYVVLQFLIAGSAVVFFGSDVTTHLFNSLGLGDSWIYIKEVFYVYVVEPFKFIINLFDYIVKELINSIWKNASNIPDTITSSQIEPVNIESTILNTPSDLIAPKSEDILGKALDNLDELKNRTWIDFLYDNKYKILGIIVVGALLYYTFVYIPGVMPNDADNYRMPTIHGTIYNSTSNLLIGTREFFYQIGTATGHAIHSTYTTTTNGVQGLFSGFTDFIKSYFTSTNNGGTATIAGDATQAQPPVVSSKDEIQIDINDPFYKKGKYFAPYEKTPGVRGTDAVPIDAGKRAEMARDADELLQLPGRGLRANPNARASSSALTLDINNNPRPSLGPHFGNPYIGFGGRTPVTPVAPKASNVLAALAEISPDRTVSDAFSSPVKTALSTQMWPDNMAVAAPSSTPNSPVDTGYSSDSSSSSTSTVRPGQYSPPATNSPDINEHIARFENGLLLSTLFNKGQYKSKLYKLWQYQASPFKHCWSLGYASRLVPVVIKRNYSISLPNIN